MLGYYIAKKNENDIANTIKKPHNFVRETKNYLKKTPNDLENYIQISQRKRKKKSSQACGCLCQNLGITGHTLKLENYSNFKSKLSFNNGNIFEIHDYFRTTGNASFNDLSQLIFINAVLKIMTSQWLLTTVAALVTAKFRPVITMNVNTQM